METILWVMAGLVGLIFYLAIGNMLLQFGMLVYVRAKDKTGRKPDIRKEIESVKQKTSRLMVWVWCVFWPFEVLCVITAAIIALIAIAFACITIFVIIASVIGLIFFIVIFALSIILFLIYFVCALIFSTMGIAFAILVFCILCVIILGSLYFLSGGFLAVPETIGNLIMGGSPVSCKRRENEKEKTKDNSFKE